MFQLKTEYVYLLEFIRVLIRSTLRVYSYRRQQDGMMDKEGKPDAARPPGGIRTSGWKKRSAVKKEIRIINVTIDANSRRSTDYAHARNRDKKEKKRHK